MATFYNVSKSRPCPICGHGDWCSIMIPEEPVYPGHELCVCRRTYVPELLSAVNGKAYLFVKEFSDHSLLYNEADAVNNRGVKDSDHYYYPPRCIKTEEELIRELSAPILPPDRLNEIYSAFLNLLPLQRIHYNKLKEDGWDHWLIVNSKIGSLMFEKELDISTGYYSYSASRTKICKKLVDQVGDIYGTPGFYRDANNNWTFTGKTGMLLPLPDMHGNIYRLRLRLDKPEVVAGKEKNKYRNFSSFTLPKIDNNTDYDTLTNIYKDGCRSGSNIGFYSTPGDYFGVCYITEGEKKAKVANHIMKTPVLSLPGVNSFKKLCEDVQYGLTIINHLRKLGCKTIVVAYDSDKFANESVLRYEELLLQELSSFDDFDLYSTKWNPGFGKGLDDILTIGIHPNWIPYHGSKIE